MADDRLRAWRLEQIRAAEALTGLEIRGWHGVEMAIRDEGADGLPVFEEEGVDCIQFLRLEIETTDGTLRVGTDMADDWMLTIEGADQVDPFGLHGIYRARRAMDLPVGVVDRVTLRTTVPSEELAEVVLSIGGRDVILVAAEITENWDSPLLFAWPDESVLLFTDRAAVEAANWTGSRKPGETFIERQVP